MIYEFKLGQNDDEATKNICCVKGEGAAEQRIVIEDLSLGL